MKITYQVVGLGVGQYVDVDNTPRHLHDRIEVDTETTPPDVLRVLEGLPEVSLLERGFVVRLDDAPSRAKKAAGPPKGDSE